MPASIGADNPGTWQTGPRLTSSLMTSSGVRVGYKDVFAGHVTREAIVHRLNRYSLGEVLDYLGRMSAILFNDRVDNDALQKELCGVFFQGDAASVWEKVEQMRAISSAPLVLLFDETALGLATKFALHAIDPSRAPTREPLKSLGEALLMVNELVDDRAPAGGAGMLRSEKSWNDWVYYQYVSGAFATADQQLHALARAYDLFLTDKPALAARSHRRDLPALTKKATGLEPDKLWTILFSFLAHFHTIDTSNAANQPAWISRTDYFHDLGFASTEVDHFFSLVASDVSDVRRNLTDHFSLNDPRPHDVLPLAQSPLIVIGDRAYCPMLRLLFEKLTAGLYHILLNGEPDSTSDGKRARAAFQNFVGDVFEDYVDRSFRRVVGSAKAQPGVHYFGPDELQSAVPPVRKGEQPSTCDHMWVEGDTVVLLDSKAKFMPLDTRCGLAEEKFVDRFGGLFVDAARQLESTIALARAGGLVKLGVDPARVRRYFPIVVSLAVCPLQPLIYEWIYRKISAEKLLQGQDTAPLEVLTAVDVDRLEEPLSQGQSLGQMLAAKFADPIWAGHSFHNYACSGVVPCLTVTRSSYLETIYSRLSTQAEAFVATAMAARGQSETL